MPFFQKLLRAYQTLHNYNSAAAQFTNTPLTLGSCIITPNWRGSIVITICNYCFHQICFMYIGFVRSIIVNVQGRIQDFQIERARKMGAHNEGEARSPLQSGPGVRLRALEVMGFQCFLILHYLRLIFKHVNTKRDWKNLDWILEDARACCPPPPPPAPPPVTDVVRGSLLPNSPPIGNHHLQCSDCHLKMETVMGRLVICWNAAAVKKLSFPGHVDVKRIPLRPPDHGLVTSDGEWLMRISDARCILNSAYIQITRDRLWKKITL